MASKTASSPSVSPYAAPGRPAWVTGLFSFLVIVIAMVALTQLLGRPTEAKDVSAFSAANATIGSLLPALLAAAVAIAIPRGQGWNVRIPLALIAGLFAIFVSRMWPSALPAATEGAETAEESSKLLS